MTEKATIKAEAARQWGAGCLPGFERRGFPKQIADLFKETAGKIIADSIRCAARGFSKKMFFSTQEMELTDGFPTSGKL
ncbi:MAG: hypothetical protein HWN68_17010 [Desulfobacterales bacterium]|nr:hypothetical protein [Desulfobacterales bacterium]